MIALNIRLMDDCFGQYPTGRTKKLHKKFCNTKKNTYLCIAKRVAIVCRKRSVTDSVAQLVEQLTLNQWVEGSSPSGVTKRFCQTDEIL